MEAELSKHYGVRVAPVTEYCAAFEAWASALGEKVKRMDAGEEREDEGLRRASEALSWLQLPIYKSSMLGRLIYGGEKLRTERCPEHNGIWSGLDFGPKFGPHCEHGCHLTGWLPAGTGTQNEEAGRDAA